MRHAIVAAGAALLTGLVLTASSAQQQPAAVPPPAVAPPSAKAAVPKTPGSKAAQPQRPMVEAKTIFGAIGTAAPLEARAIGFYSRGCLAGAKPLPIDGPLWQAMRLSRNRNWGHPDMIAMIERLAADAKAHDDWPGLLVGDISQPRGGPMLTGHASHQIGLDADIWLTPMPGRRLSQQEREDLSATSMLGSDGILVDPKVWTLAHARLILRAASYPEVERVLVHPGIKKALCLDAGNNRAPLTKIRPFWGHNYHMHVRIACPKGSTNCQPQPVTPLDDGCGKEVDDWLALLRRPPKPADPGVKPAPPKPGLTLDQLPPECRLVVDAGAPEPRTASKAARGKAAAAGK